MSPDSGDSGAIAPSTTKLGFVGVGHMGKYMCGNLIKAGFHVTVCDRRPEARDEEVLQGAHWVDTPAEVAAASKVTLSSLPGPPQVDAVVFGEDGLLEGFHDGDFYIDMSTSTPKQIREIADAVAPRGIEVLDAPVAGGMRGARNGTLTIMAGGNRAAYDVVEPALQAMGEKIFLVGGVGAGHIAKLVNNMMSIANALVAMEAMVVGVKAGVDPQSLIDVCDAGTGGSFALNVFRYVIFQGNFEPAKFAPSLAAKDLRVSVEYAEELGVPLTIMPVASKAMADAMELGLADKDWSSYITLLEEAAGVEVRT